MGTILSRDAAWLRWEFQYLKRTFAFPAVAHKVPPTHRNDVVHTLEGQMDSAVTGAQYDALRHLDALFHPRSIAVVGASNDPNRIGGVPLALMIERGYAGRLIPINPKYETVQGLRAYPCLAAVGEPIDIAIVAVPAAGLAATLEDAITAGVKALVVFSSGFAEVNPAGRDLQE